VQVRQQVAEQLYAAFITFEYLVPSEHHQTVLDLLTNTHWSFPLSRWTIPKVKLTPSCA
jgi:hypothetical protein